MSIEVEIVGGISQTAQQEWDALGDGSPLVSHAFLSALETAGCVGQGTGWQPYPLLVRQAGKLIGAMPLYLKSHSYGEYVFDWAWAEAYERNGLAYYPKLLVAIPFTPLTGCRLFSKDEQVRALLTQVLAEQMQKHALSSAHILFPDDASAAVMREQGWIERSGVQFRWENEDFRDFADFLTHLSHDKRKKIRQERNKLAAAGVRCEQIAGGEVTSAQWDFFYQCYQNTYREHRSTPYLTPEFFHLLGKQLPANSLLIIARQQGKPIAAALNLFDQNVLYGRYWGATQYMPALHFELCYYQAQEFCIRQGIRFFEGGAQGEHKLSRGFKPRATCSFHKIAHPEFDAAIRSFVRQEAQGIAVYHSGLEERMPFRRA